MILGKILSGEGQEGRTRENKGGSKEPGYEVGAGVDGKRGEIDLAGCGSRVKAGEEGH